MFPLLLTRNTLPRVSLPLALARTDRPAAATARTSCSWSVRGSRSPMLLTAAADVIRGGERERERGRERERLPRRAVSVGRHLRRERASAAEKTTRSRRGEEGDRSANYSAAEQRAHATAGFHSVVYRSASWMCLRVFSCHPRSPVSTALRHCHRRPSPTTKPPCVETTERERERKSE